MTHETLKEVADQVERLGDIIIDILKDNKKLRDGQMEVIRT